MRVCVKLTDKNTKSKPHLLLYATLRHRQAFLPHQGSGDHTAEGRRDAHPGTGMAAAPLYTLPQEILQEVLQYVHCAQWPAIRLVNQHFEAALAPLVKRITIRQWPCSTASSRHRICIATSSSLIHTQHVSAVVDNSLHLAQLLEVLLQLPVMAHLSLRGMQPLATLNTKTAQASQVNAAMRLSNPVPAVAAGALAPLARLRQLDLPDSSSSSLPAGVHLPGLTAMTLYAVDSIRHLAAFAPQLQHLECFSLTAPHTQQLTATATAAHNNSGSSDDDAVLQSCSTLGVQFVSASSAPAAVAGLASALPRLSVLLAVPQLQQLGSAADADPLQQCQEITLQELQQVLPGLTLAGGGAAGHTRSSSSSSSSY